MLKGQQEETNMISNRSKKMFELATKSLQNTTNSNKIIRGRIKKLPSTPCNNKFEARKYETSTYFLSEEIDEDIESKILEKFCCSSKGKL